MKVAYYIGSLSRGGTESLMLDICKKNDMAPFDILLIYRNEGNMSDAYRETGVQMIRIKPKRGRFISYLWQLRRIVEQENIDVVHAQTLMNGVLAVFFLLGTKIRLVTSFHGFFNDWKSKIARHIVRWGSDAACFVSGYEREWYVARSWCDRRKCYTVYNGVDFSKFELKNERVRELENERMSRLCMVGNFVSVRTQIVLVKAIGVLKKRGIEDFDFYFIGRRDEIEPWRYDDCVRYCNDSNLTNVHFLGSRSDVPSLLKQMDGFVYSTDHDTFGIAVVEAMAEGLPVVVNDHPVMKEVCGEANLAVQYYRSKDPADAADKIRELLIHIETSRKAAEANAAIIREKYSINRHIEHLSAVYEVCVSE